MANGQALSNVDLVYDVVKSAGQPLTFNEIFDRVNQRRPITTRNPKATIRGTVTGARMLVNLGDGRYGYLPQVRVGSLLRLPLTEEKPANHPLKYSDEIIQALWPSFHEVQKRQDRRPIRVQLPNGDEAILPLDLLGTGSWGCLMPEPLRQSLVDQRAAAGDALLIRVVDESGGCEIRFESRRERDENAVAARNRELADATARLLQRGQSYGTPIWDLVVPLLARGVYRSDLAPDPLATVLTNDPRFEAAGFHAWLLAESMTPAMKAEIRERQRLERELFSGGPGLFAIGPGEVEASVPAGFPFAGCFSLERALADVDAFLTEHEPATIDEANALIQGLLAQGGLPRRAAATPLEQAQELMYDAWEAASPRERVRLARKAIEISEDCADAYVLLAEETARGPKEAADLYAQGVAAGERALGKEIFEEAVGEFWGIIETRPYMRARFGLAQALWATGEHQPAIRHLQDMLRLNPGDNQGVRYVLLTWLLDLDAHDAIQALLDAYDDDVSAVWAYSRALHAFRQHGDTPASRKLRRDARRWNPHVPDYLAGRKRLPRQLPELIGMGDESEAVYYVAEQLAAWKSTPGAVSWLSSGPR